MRIVKQCEDCAYSKYSNDVGICCILDHLLCSDVNPDNDCDQFREACAKTRCVDDESEGA